METYSRGRKKKKVLYFKKTKGFYSTNFNLKLHLAILYSVLVIKNYGAIQLSIFAILVFLMLVILINKGRKGKEAIVVKSVIID